MIFNADDNSRFPFQSYIPHEPSDSPPHIEPIFWGTSDLLVWDMQQIFSLIDKDLVFSTIVNDNGFPAPQKERYYSTIFIPAFKEVTDYFLHSLTIKPCGIYGYFPVITENGGIVVLDPCDFHSELFILNFNSDATNSDALIDRFNPDGDVIAFGAVTIGYTLTNTVKNAVGFSLANPEILKYTGHAIVRLLETRIITEIYKGLGIAEECGNFISLDEISTSAATLATIFEIMSFEERLGMSVDTGGVVSPIYSYSGIFIHPS